MYRTNNANLKLLLIDRKQFQCFDTVIETQLNVGGLTRNWSGQFWDMASFTITWLLCAFSLVVDRDLWKDTHRWRQIHAIHVSELVFLFSCPPNPWINLLNFYCIKQVDNILACVCTVLYNRRHHSVWRTTVTPLDFVWCRTFLFFTRCDDICDLLQYTRTHGKM